MLDASDASGTLASYGSVPVTVGRARACHDAYRDRDSQAAQLVAAAAAARGGGVSG